MGSDFFDSEPAKKVLAEMQEELSQVREDLEKVDYYLEKYWEGECSE